MSYKVKNLGGTSNPRYLNARNNRGCSTWIAYWRHSNEIPESWELRCSVYACKGTGSVGAHVHFTIPSDDGTWYIIPMCPDHNNPLLKQSQGELTVTPTAHEFKAPLRPEDDFTCRQPKPKPSKKPSKKSSKKSGKKSSKK
eukprot:scpid88993/ scgid32624/ 